MDVGSLISSQPQLVSAALVLSGTTMLLLAIGTAVNIWDKTRRKPPLDQELQFYAKKSDLAAVEQRVMDGLRLATERHEKIMEKHSEDQTAVIRDIFSRMNSSQKAIEETFRMIMHELGLLTGRIKK